MHVKQKTCRNCSSGDVITRASGVLAPFFVQRVLGLESYTIGERLEERAKYCNSRIGQFFYRACLGSRKIPLVERLFSYTSLAKADVRVCHACGFIGPEVAYSPEALSGLYLDYRSENYNLDRCKYEPDYAKIQHLVGKSPLELKLRLDNVDELLANHVDTDRISSVLDWGGGEGRFVPRSMSSKNVHILDISDEKPVNPEHRRIVQPDENAKYDFIQVCHVLEHVAEPLDLLGRIVGYLNKDGLLYIEVPQDRSDDDLASFKTSPESMRHTIHEHLNLYSVGAIEAIGGALGLHKIAIEKHVLDLEGAACTIVSGLFVKA